MDIVVLNADGNLADLVSLTVYSALTNTNLPAVEVFRTEEDADFNIVPYPIDGKEFPKVLLKSLPIRVSLYRIGDSMVADVSEEEQSVSSCYMSVMVNAESRICGTSIEDEGFIKLSNVADYLYYALVIARQLFVLLGSEL